MKIKIPLEIVLKFGLCGNKDNAEIKWRYEYRGPYDNPLPHKKKYNPITDSFNK